MPPIAPRRVAILWGWILAPVALLAPNPLAATPRLILSWNDASHLLGCSDTPTKGNVTQTLADTGVPVTWTRGTVPESDSASAVGVRVIIMPFDSSRWSLPKHAMGVVIGDRAPRERVFVFIPNLLQSLDYPQRPDCLRPPKQRANLAKALGRVIVHELIHVIVPGRPHDSSGIFSSRLTRASLRRRRLTLSVETARIFLDRVNATANRAHVLNSGMDPRD